ncbi:SDR family NAD(P)-dependent oxidoreductase [Actinosynnema pretiosum]|uniref:Acetoin dehydrogenase n=1 Tax=Actinosynnema pretiosum TaxID=42197 RepID=A0A290Z899_9PSEU|nr:SDR family NAD(P)-dependent oxidoreductase [Actinosynnema pretiosum]ATE55202.1 acetoin dehydrogenase [Actinosynnema pretiosum]
MSGGTGDGFAGRVAAITGAGSGIGRALAVELAGRGARLALSDVDGAGLEATAERCRARGAEVSTRRLDVTEREDVLAWAGEVVARFGAVDQVYANAGVAYYGEVAAESFEDVERVLDVNFWGVVNTAKAFLPHVIASGDGRLVTVSSLFGLIAMPAQSAYNASKFAVRGFTEALRQEMLVARHPVRVTCVHPGGVRTAVARSARAAEGLDAGALAANFDRRFALTSPERAAGVILGGVRRGRPRVLVGPDARVLDLFGRLSPVAYQRFGAWFSRFLAPPKPKRG